MPKNSKGKTQVKQTGLYWPDKRTEVERVILPFQIVETVNESKADREELSLFRQKGEPAPGWRNKLIWGDNKYIMSSLLKDYAGKINLIYIDPPFATGADFTLNMKLGDLEWTKEASVIEEKAYRDTWGRGLDSYLQMLYDRLVLMRELLADNGSIYVHLDYRVAHYVKLIMDEIFGSSNFLNEVIHCYGEREKIQRLYNRKHQTILFYVKDVKSDYIFNADEIREVFSETTVAKYKYEDEKGRYRIRGVNRKEAGRLRAKTDLRPEDECEYTYRDYLHARSGPAPRDWFIKPFLNQAALERVGYPTQKNPEVIERFVSASSLPGQLVADFFCGSGAAGIVAEKLGRRWIMADLSKFAIHTTRKWLLDIPDCKPFEVLNLGRYQKAKLKENGITSYIDFICKLYRAEPLTGYTTLHGKKAGRMVHIGGVDSIITLREIQEAAEECAEAGANALDVLGWDFEMGLHDLADKLDLQSDVKTRLVQIPREALEVKDADREEVKFFDLNYLDLEHKLKGKALTITLKDFVISNPEYLPQDVREKIKKFTDYIDYWAVDFNYRDDTFHNMWQSFRTKKHPSLKTKCAHTYEKPGSYHVLVKVVDIFGNDTNKLIEVKVK